MPPFFTMGSDGKQSTPSLVMKSSLSYTEQNVNIWLLCRIGGLHVDHATNNPACNRVDYFRLGDVGLGSSSPPLK